MFITNTINRRSKPKKHFNYISYFCVIIMISIFWCDSAEAVLKVDFGEPDIANLQPGWDLFTLGYWSQHGGILYGEVVSEIFGNTTVSVTPSENSEAGAFAQLANLDSLNITTGTLNLMIKDYLYSNDLSGTGRSLNGIDLSFDGLDAGLYSIKTYHNVHTSEYDTSHKDMHITIKDALSEGRFRDLAVNLQPSSVLDSSNAQTQTFIFESDGVNTITMRLMPTWFGGTYPRAVINGFEMDSAIGLPDANDFLNVDFGPSAQTLEPDFLNFALDEPLPYYKTEMFPCSLGVANTVTVKITEEQAYTSTDDINTSDIPGVTHTKAGLISDFISISGTMSLTLSDLKPGYYELTTYHNDPNTARPPVTIKIKDTEGSNYRVAANLLDQSNATQNGDHLTSPSFIFKSDGTDVQILFEGKVGIGAGDISPIAVFNGFRLTESSPDKLAVDFGATGQNLQTNFDAFTSSTATSVLKTYTNPFAASGTIDVNIAKSGTVAQQVDFTNTGSMDAAHSLTDLLSDLTVSSPVGLDSALELTLSGLDPNIYTLYTYHNDPTQKHPQFDVYINGELTTFAFEPSQAVTPGDTVSIHTSTFEVPQGASDVTVLMEVGGLSGQLVTYEGVTDGDFPDVTSLAAKWIPSGGETSPVDPNLPGGYYEDDGVYGGLYYTQWNWYTGHFPSSRGHKAYRFQHIHNIVDSDVYNISADLGWRWWGDYQHSGDSINTFVGLAIADDSIDPSSPYIDLTDYMVPSATLSDSMLLTTFTGDTWFQWFTPTPKTVSYTATAADAGKKLYIVIGGSLDDVTPTTEQTGEGNSKGVQSIIDNVNVEISTVVDSDGPVGINGFELISGQFNPKSYHPEFCGDYGTIYFAGDLDLNCYTNIFDFIKIAAKWLECNDPTGFNCL